MKDEYRIRLTKNELKIIKAFAKRNKCSVSSALKRIVFDKLYDELDIKLLNEYEALKEKGKLVLRPIDELWKELKI